MTPMAVRQLQELRRQLFDEKATEKPATAVNETVVPAA